MQQTDPKDRFPAPTACPACRSADVGTTSKTIDDATYWRCHTCGEVWNASRRRETRDLPYYRR